ncbi:MAG: PEP-CTERM sorting domain-containing protein [Burkholderiales bacterium]|nr:PEP-CTERM sorting domain-containing protein [Burkholderiales bacterium]
MLHRLKPVVVAVTLLGASAAAQATTLTGNFTVDNQFRVWLSTSPTTAGTLIASGNDWPTTFSLSATLTPGVTQYLHVQAHDYGVIAGFLGDFSLSDSGFSFANGTQSLSTDTVHWQVSPTGFGTDLEAPVVQNGNNGVSPWGLRGGIASSTPWIWSADNCTYCTRTFTTEINPAVPEPGTWALMGVGLALVAGGLRRARQGRTA